MRLISVIPTKTVLFLILLSQGCASPFTDKSNDPPPQYIVDPSWPRKPDQFTWGQTPGVTVDSQDHI